MKKRREALRCCTCHNALPNLQDLFITSLIACVSIFMTFAPTNGTVLGLGCCSEVHHVTPMSLSGESRGQMHQTFRSRQHPDFSVAAPEGLVTRLL